MNEENDWKNELKEAESKLFFFDGGTKTEASKPGDLWEIPDWLKKTKTKWAKTLIRLYKHPMSFPGSVSPNAGVLLRSLVMNIAPKTVIEVGSFIGASSIWVASAMAEYDRRNKLYCLDLFPPAHGNNVYAPGVIFKDPSGFIAKNMKKCGFEDFVETFRGDSKVLIHEIAKKIDAPVDFAIIDGDHTVEGCVADFMAMEKHVVTGGYILLHDIFIDYCGVDGPAYTLIEKIKPLNKKFEACQIYTAPLNFGYALIRKIAE
jgi:predicted O-methyltransferase YrrM